MTATCPNGHTSEADDFCDTCGAKIDPSQQASASGGEEGEVKAEASSSEQTCPNCQTVNATDALFCEACGYDFTTGALPRGAAPLASQQASGHGSAGNSLSLDPTPEAGSVNAVGSPIGSEGPDGEGGGGTAPDGPERGGATGQGDGHESEASLAGASEAQGLDGDPLAGEVESHAPEGRKPAAPADGASAPVGAGANIAPSIPLEWVAEVWVDPDWYSGQEAEEPMPSPGLPSVVPLLHRSALIGRVSSSRNITPDIDCATDTGVSRRHAQLSTDGTRWFVEDLGSSNGTYIGPASGPLPEDPITVGPRTELDGDDRIYVGAWTRIVVRKATEDEVAAHAE